MSGSNAASPPEIRVENDKGEAAGSGLTTGQVKSDNPWAICLLVVNFDVEFGQKIELVYPPTVQFNDATSSNIAFCSIPDSATSTGDVVYSFKTLMQNGNESKPIYGYTFFRQAKDASLARGFLQKSVVLLSYLSDVNLFKECIRLIAHTYLNSGVTSLEAAWSDITSWPQPKSSTELELPLLGSVLKVNSAVKQAGAYFSSVVSFKSPIPPLFTPFSPVDLYTSLRGLYSKLWLLWEMVLLGEPIIVASSSPNACSDASLALASIIAPLEYAGELKPFFTIHDSDFKQYSEIEFDEGEPARFPAIILGVTNPYFLKAMEHWPHLVIVGNETEKKVAKIKKGGKDRSFRTVTEFKNQVVTEYKPFYLPNKEILKAAKLASKNGVAHDNTLSLHFYRLTELFMYPIERYFKSLLPSADAFSIFSAPPEPKNFKEAAFLTQLLDAEKKPKEINIYRRFIRTKTFVNWYKQRKRNAVLQIRQAYADFIKSFDPIPMLKGKSEIEIVDLYLRARSFLDKSTSASSGSYLFSAELKKHYRKILDQMLSCLPSDLQESLHIKRKAALAASSTGAYGSDSGSDVGSWPGESSMEAAAEARKTATSTPTLRLKATSRARAASNASYDSNDDAVLETHNDDDQSQLSSSSVVEAPALE